MAQPIRLLLVSTLLLIAPTLHLRSQDEPTPAPVVLPVPRYAVDADGRLTIAIGKDGKFEPVEFGGETLMAGMGLSGYLAMLVCGGTDLVSLTDAANFFQRREGGEDVGILRTLARKRQDGDGPHQVLLRILAARAAQMQEFKPALGMVQRVLSEEHLDPALREACEDAAAVLRGEALPAHRRDIEPLQQVLAKVPAGVEALLVQNTADLPSGGVLMPVVRRMGEASDQRIAEMMRDRGSDGEFLQRGARNVAIAANFGYVLAHEFGNLRIDRLILALRSRGDLETQPYFFLHVDGDWDVARLAAGFRRLGASIEGDDKAFSVTSHDGHTLHVDAKAITLDHEDFNQPGGADGATALMAQIRPNAALSLWLSDTAPYPTEAGVFRIVNASLELPHTQKEHLRIHTTWATPAAATAVAGWTGGLGRLVAGFADRHEELVPFADAASEIKTVREGKDVDFDVPLPEGDLAELLEKLISTMDR